MLLLTGLTGGAVASPWVVEVVEVVEVVVTRGMKNMSIGRPCMGGISRTSASEGGKTNERQIPVGGREHTSTGTLGGRESRV